MVVCKTLKQVLCDQINIKQMAYDRKNIPPPYAHIFIDKCFDFVSRLAKSKGIHIAKKELGETQLNRTIAIVDSIENLRRKVDFVTVQQKRNIASLLRIHLDSNGLTK